MHLDADDEAVSWFRRGIEANRNYPLAHFSLAAALPLLGKLEEAKVAIKTGLELDPTFTIRRMKSLPMGDNTTFVTGARRILRGMRLAGIPEG